VTTRDSLGLLRAGALLPVDEPPAAHEPSDTFSARTYTHPALGDRPVVRLVPDAIAPAEDLALEFLGLRLTGATRPLARGRRQALGFPGWALVNDPANGRYALAIVKDIERLARLARAKPGNARDGFEREAPDRALALHPRARARIASADLAAALARTLRGGLLDELGWPALEDAWSQLAAGAIQVGYACPNLILNDRSRALVVGPSGIVLAHDLRQPPGIATLAPIRLLYAGGQLLVIWHSKNVTCGYWSARPDAVFDLESGALGAGLVLVGELLRAVHSCRLASLPRLSAAGLRVAQDLRDLQAQRPEFRLELLAADFHELLRTATALREAESARPAWIGAARRAYAPVGSLRVMGLFSEAIVSSAGYAGVVTYVCDQHGQLWSIANVAPGGPERCQLAYSAPVDLGDASFDHRSLGRAGLHLQHATGAGNHRLGAGRGVGAVRADGCNWTDAPLVGLWSASLETQLDRAWTARGRPVDERRAGDDLLFVRGVLMGAREDALALRVGNVAMAGFAPGAHAELAYQHNLRLFAATPGLPLLIVGRVAFDRPRTLLLLAVAPDAPAAASAPALELPPVWAGRVNLGLDQLQGAHLHGAAGGIAVPTAGAAFSRAVDPLSPFRMRLQQVLLGGRAAISPATWSGVARDESQLERNQLPTAAQLLRALKSAPLQREGRRDRLAHAWLGGRTYLTAASTRLQRLGWLTPSPSGRGRG